MIDPAMRSTRGPGLQPTASSSARSCASREDRTGLQRLAVHIAFDRDETFLGAELARSLNRRTDVEGFQFLYALTPLTTFAVRTERDSRPLASETTRNADSYRVMPGFEFKPFALISGSAFVGFRHFNALNDAIPDFDGVVATVDARYVIRATRCRRGSSATWISPTKRISPTTR